MTSPRAAPRIGLIVEDIRWGDFLAPATSRLVARFGSSPVVELVENLHGCSVKRLVQALTRSESYDLVVVGADTRAPHNTFKKKRAALAAALPPIARTPSLAVAQPSIESWLLSEPNAVVSGLSRGLGESFRQPRLPPPPRSEREAKSSLGAFVYEVVGGPIPRGGFEFAEEIVAAIDLPNSRAPGLADWARSFVRELEAYFRGDSPRQRGPA